MLPLLKALGDLQQATQALNCPSSFSQPFQRQFQLIRRPRSILMENNYPTGPHHTQHMRGVKPWARDLGIEREDIPKNGPVSKTRSLFDHLRAENTGPRTEILGA